MEAVTFSNAVGVGLVPTQFRFILRFAFLRDTEFSAKLILAYFHRREERFKQNFARMNGGYFLCLHFFTSMIINDPKH